MNAVIPEGVCQCGCGQRTRIAKYTRSSAGWKRGMPIRFVMNHDKRKLGPKWKVDKETGCWNWLGFINRKGYGTLNGRMAHKVLWEKKNGPTPEGHTIDHTCRNRRCVNLDHLEAVPHKVNCHRGAQTILQDIDIPRIAEMWNAGATAKAIGELFGLARGTVEAIVCGRQRVVPGVTFIRKQIISDKSGPCDGRSGHCPECRRKYFREWQRRKWAKLGRPQRQYRWVDAAQA